MLRLHEPPDQRRQRLLLVDGYAELAVHMRGDHIFMRMRLHARIDPDHHMDIVIETRHLRAEIFPLHDIVYDEGADLCLQRFFDLLRRLIVAVEMDVRRIKAGRQRRIQLSAGDDIQAQPVRLHQLHHLLDAECLGRIQDLGLQHIAVQAASVSLHLFLDTVLIIDI